MKRRSLIAICVAVMFFAYSPSEGVIAGDDTLPSETTDSSRKRALLTALVGEHPLVSVSGSTGANTMVDYTIVNGEWTVAGSAISDGEREPDDLELDESDVKVLESARIVVSKDLSVSYHWDGGTYLSAPFKADGMTYSLKKPADKYIPLPEGVEASASFVKGDLYLLVRDDVEDIETLDMVGVEADVAFLKYDEKAGAFKLMLFYGECCDASIYTFKK